MRVSFFTQYIGTLVKFTFARPQRSVDANQNIQTEMAAHGRNSDDSNNGTKAGQETKVKRKI